MTVPELDALTKAYETRVTAADVPYLAAVADLDKKYVIRLEQEQSAAQQAGKLDEAMAIEAEKKTISEGGAVPAQDDDKTPLVLRKMHATYRAESAKLTLARDRNLKPLRDDYARKLEALVTGLTKAGMLQQAMTVRQFRENLLQDAGQSVSSTATSQIPAAGKVMSVKLPGKVVMKFCYCPAGSFRMGSPPDEPGRRGNEDQVKVRLSKGYWLAQTECTQKQWVAVMGSNPSTFKGDDLPVETLNWQDVQKFITKLNEAKTPPAGWKAALPTEAQWEYACRAGTKTAYSYGDTLNPKQANFDKVLGKTCAVASYPPNAWGLYDMHGNVWEWCEDWLGEKLHGGTDPTGEVSSLYRVIRGCDWSNNASTCRAAYRITNYLSSSIPGSNLGFRLALIAVP